MGFNDLWAFEKEAEKNGFSNIAGIDEAGRGPLAGPVVAAAVILPLKPDPPAEMAEISDSKKLTPKKRDFLFPKIYAYARSVGIGIVDSNEIDRINILQASLLAMAFAVHNLSPVPDYLLIDGNFGIKTNLPQLPVIKGDNLSISIAAASIIAKVTRDRMMQKYDEQFPEYGFIKHKGYPTKAHKSAILEHGCCFIHRFSFRGTKSDKFVKSQNSKNFSCQHTDIIRSQK